MAEVVFQNLEERIPELEELQNQGIFTHEELRFVIKRRTDFEYKLQKRIIEKQDLLSYLEYEMKLDQLRRKRTKKMKLKSYSTASLGMNRKIHALFRKGLMKFPDDLKLWMQYIQFCKMTDSRRAIGLAFGKLLQQHANNPEVWLMAAKHEVEQLNSFETARLILQKALRNNQESTKLWHEYFRVELMHVDKIKKRKKLLLEGGIEMKDSEETEPEMIEDFLLYKTAEIVFLNSTKIIQNDIEFRLKFLSVCQDFEDTEKLEDLIYNSLETDFPEDELVYEALSIRPITQLKSKKEFIIKDNDWVRVEGEVQTNFKEAVLKKKSPMMWERYLIFFSNLIKDSNSPHQVERRLVTILDILKGAEESKCMTESMYLFWNELLLQVGKDSNTLDCLETALETFNKSTAIWQNYLFIKMKNIDSWESMKTEFKKCISLLKGNDLPIWKMYLDSSLSVGTDDTRLVFEEAVECRKETKDLFLPQYLSWLYETLGILHARKLYHKHIEGAVVDKVFLQNCIDIENLQDKRSLKKIRFLHKKAITDFGKTHTDVWLAYINFERECAVNDIDRVGKIYMKAKKTLEGKLNAQFIKEYSLI